MEPHNVTVTDWGPGATYTSVNLTLPPQDFLPNDVPQSEHAALHPRSRYRWQDHD